jgi:hypothetical protein
MFIESRSRPIHRETIEHTMTWEILPIHRFAEHAQGWDSLLQTGLDIPCLESAFLQPLLETFGTGEELLALESEQGALRAAAILYKTRPGIWQTFQPSQLPLGPWIATPGTDLVRAAGGLLRALPGYAASLGITQLDPILQTRPADMPSGQTLDYIDTAWVDVQQPFEEYWEARGKNLKSNTRKQRTKLQNEGITPCLECITRPEDVAEALQNYGALESAGWKAKDGTAIHPDNAQGHFYRAMLENFCALGRGRIYRYWFADKVVAMDLCIESGDRIVILKTAYDESHKSVSPSSLMRQEQFQALFDEGRLKRIEFYGRVMEWHTRWTDSSRTLYHANVYRNSAIRGLMDLRNRLRKKSAAPGPDNAMGTSAS